jgi:glycerol-3-phosphate dehydrogenase (NAD(P)+)
MASTTAVMGAGAWGTALARLLASAGGEVTLWARRSEVADEINTSRRNPDYLPGVELPPGVRATGDAQEALSGVTTVLLAVPAQTMRANVEKWASLFAEGATLVSTAKGIE